MSIITTAAAATWSHTWAHICCNRHIHFNFLMYS